MVKPIKSVIVGLQGIGKTTLLETLMYGSRGNKDVTATTEDIYVASIDSDRGTKETLRIYDTEGINLTDFSTGGSILKPYYTLADVFILAYRIDNRISFDLVDWLKRDIEKNKEKREILILVIAICGKNGEPREVDPSLAIGWCSREKIRHFEVTLTDRRTLVTPFLYIGSKCNIPPPKAAFAPLGIGSKKPKDT